MHKVIAMYFELFYFERNIYFVYVFNILFESKLKKGDRTFKFIKL